MPGPKLYTNKKRERLVIVAMEGESKVTLYDFLRTLFPNPNENSDEEIELIERQLRNCADTFAVLIRRRKYTSPAEMYHRTKEKG